VRELDLSESDVSDAALAVISRYGAMLRKVDLNAAKVDRMNVTSSGKLLYEAILYRKNRKQMMKTVGAKINLVTKYTSLVR
jgi:hypothetical protein